MKLNNLGIFLVHDIGCTGTIEIRKWLSEESSGEYGTNAHSIEMENNHIVVKFEYADDPDNAECFSLAKKIFLNILDEWEKVCKEKPKEVIITEENGKYTFEKKF